MDKAWISVKERLPEDDTLVLTCDGYGDVDIYTHVVRFTSGWVRKCNDLSDEVDVADCCDSKERIVAWMELPKPYREDDK